MEANRWRAPTAVRISSGLNSQITKPHRNESMNDISATQPTQTSTWRSSMNSITKTSLTFFALATIGVTAWKLNQQYDLSTPLMSLAFVTGTGLAIAYRIANPLGWNLVIRGMGYNVSAWSTTRIWLLAESRRWLPGGIWGYTSRAVAAQGIGLTKTVASASMAIELLATIAAAACVSVLGILFHHSDLRSVAVELLKNSGLNSNLAFAFAVASATAMAATWMMRKTLNRRIVAAAQKFESLRNIRIQRTWLVGSVGYLILMAALNGAVNSVLLNAVSAQHVPTVAMIAATSIAWLIGFFAFFSPGGILVREAALAALLLPWLPCETGFALAVLSRFAQLIAEVVGMAATIRKRPRR